MKRERREEAKKGSALFFNVFIISSDTTCHSEHAHGGQRAALWVNLSFLFYVGSRDQTQPTACWSHFHLCDEREDGTFPLWIEN